MNKIRKTVLESDPGVLSLTGQSRRRFLATSFSAAVALAGFPALLRAADHGDAKAGLPQKTLELLKSSPYVYISPLKSNGEESQCHGEVWYAWLDGSVVVTVAADRWKARAIENGLDGARIWVGDHGRWKGVLSNNEDFRKAPSFDARAEQVVSEQVLDQLLADYETKYPKEIGRWRDRMRSGYKDGSRILIRYVPKSTAS